MRLRNILLIAAMLATSCCLTPAFAQTAQADLRPGSFYTPSESSEPTCQQSTAGKTMRVESTGETPYVAVCQSNGDGTYSWHNLNHESSDGFSPVEFYGQDVYTPAAGPPLRAYPIGALRDGKLYGRGPGGAGTECQKIYESSDGVTWTQVADTASVLSNCPNNIMDIAGGEVAITSSARLVTSSGWGGTETWTSRVTPTGSSEFLSWAMDTCPDCGNGWITVSEYIATTPYSTWVDSRYVRLSTDNGVSFSTIFDLESVDPGQDHHLHGTAIDPWAIVGGTPRLWVSWHRQTAAELGLAYSDDGGSSWTELADRQPTTLRAARYGMVFGADYNPEGVHIARRTAAATDMVFEDSATFVWAGNSSGFSRTAWRDHRDGVVYDAFGAQVADTPSYITASDGANSTTIEWYMPDDSGTDDVTYNGVWSVGEKLVVSYDDNGTLKYFVTIRPTRGSPSQEFYNYGNIFPPDQRPDDTSVSVGKGSRAVSQRSTSVGYRAKTTSGEDDSTAVGSSANCPKADCTVLGSQAKGTTTTSVQMVAIGDESQADQSSVAIGSKTKAGQYSTVVGANINASAINNATLFGYNLTVPVASGLAMFGRNSSSTGSNSSVFGDGAGCGPNCVSFGANASAGDSSVALGYGATATNTRVSSVAVGRNAVTTGNYTVAIGRDATIANGNHNSIAIGYGANNVNVVNDCISIGTSAQCGHEDSVAIGENSSTSAANQFVVGDRNIYAQGSRVTHKYAACFTLEDATTSDLNIPIAPMNEAATVTAVGCRVSGTSATLTFEDNAASPNTIKSSVACQAGSTAMTWDTASLTNTALTVGEFVQFDVTAATATGWLTACFEYTVN